MAEGGGGEGGAGGEARVGEGDVPILLGRKAGACARDMRGGMCAACAETGSVNSPGLRALIPEDFVRSFPRISCVNSRGFRALIPEDFVR